MNKLSISKRAEIIHLLVEGNSLRAAARIARVELNTVLSLLVKVGEACSQYQNHALHNLPCKRVQVDEIWSFCYAKNKNIDKVKIPQEEMGDIWTWIAICADTKLIISWFVGDRDLASARMFMSDLAPRMSGRIHLTSDGYVAYDKAVRYAFNRSRVDFVMANKLYDENRRYIGCEKDIIIGKPDVVIANTSIVERQNLTMRMGIRRFTRKTNGFSKKIDNHICAVSLHFAYYNFARIHSTLRVTPAMEAGITDHVWSIEEIVGLVKEEKPKLRGAYKMKTTNSMCL